MMRAIMMMFDSLNRRMLEPYGCTWLKTPNFTRLSQKAVTFTSAFAGSMPCMPARREIHTGRYNFLHRSWGPLEPFDDSMPELLKNNGIHTHLVSDHYHYWEEGGSNYHTKYTTWEIIRGQEGDPWKGIVDPGPIPKNLNGWDLNPWRRQDWINRRYMHGDNHPQKRTLSKGLEFIDMNHKSDGWFLTIETFDPHEPYFTDDEYKKEDFSHDYSGPLFDWPAYGKPGYSRRETLHCRYGNAALVRMCDEQLGRLLDSMDKYDMWKDTVLIVNTDHGFLLGEHDYWGKCAMPFYNEIVHIPFFLWDPRTNATGGICEGLVQTIDLAPSLLNLFDVEVPEHMQGGLLFNLLTKNKPIRNMCLFGMFGGHVNCTDGQYVYMRAPGDKNEPLFEYTYMPSHMKQSFSVNELRETELAEPFGFTKGCRPMKIPGRPFHRTGLLEFHTMLFDTKADPDQSNPIMNRQIEEYMTARMVELMKLNEAPPEQFERLGL